MVPALLIAGSAQAGGWARPVGSVYARAGAALFQGEDTFLLADGASGEFYSLAAELYTEVGLGRNLELDLSLRWVENVNTLDDGPTLREQGLEDLEARLEWALLNRQQAVAFVLGLRQALYGRRSATDSLDGRPQRGPGGTDILIGASFGHSFYPTGAWITVDVLARIRAQNPSSGVQTRVEAGWMLHPHFGAAATVELQPAFGRDADQDPDAPAPVPTVFGGGLKLLAPIALGVGLAAEVMGWPNALNDGPGYRIALSLTYEWSIAPNDT